MPEFDIQPIDEDEILREPFKIAEIEARTELTSAQIETTNKAQSLAIVFNNVFLAQHINGFLVKQKSLQRKSMGEFVTIVKSRMEDIVTKSRSAKEWLMG